MGRLAERWNATSAACYQRIMSRPSGTTILLYHRAAEVVIHHIAVCEPLLPPCIAKRNRIESNPLVRLLNYSSTSVSAAPFFGFGSASVTGAFAALALFPVSSGTISSTKYGASTHSIYAVAAESLFLCPSLKIRVYP